MSQETSTRSIKEWKIPHIEFDEYVLDNGLNVILHQNRYTPLVVVSVMYHVGSKNDPEQRKGFAHFFEHLLFEGSENIGRGEFAKIVEGSGGMLNANTSNDRTYYYEVMPAHHLATSLWLESERMLHARVDQIGIDTQRGVVKEERLQRYDNQPYGTVIEEIMKRVFINHPYHWTTIGSMEHLAAATAQDFVDFYKDYYVPNNAVLTISGDFETKEAKELVDKYFASIPKGLNLHQKHSPSDLPLLGELRDTVYDNIQLPAVVIAYRMPGILDDDYQAVMLLSQYLAGGESSLFNQVLVDDTQLAVNAGAFSYPLEDLGVFICYGIAQIGVEPKELEQKMEELLSLTFQEIMPDYDFMKLKNTIIAQQVKQLSTLSGIAEELASSNTFYKNTNEINTSLDKILSITKEDILKASNKYLKTNNRVVLHFMPKPQ